MKGDLFIQYGVSCLVFCEVSPVCDEYGKAYPVYCMYSDGSWSRQSNDSYYRSPMGKLRKAPKEYTFEELAGIVHEVKGNVVSKEFAEHCYNDNVRLAIEYITKRIKEEPEHILKIIAVAGGGTLDGLWKHYDKMETCKKLML